MSVIHTISVPITTVWQPERALQFIAQFLASFPQVAFRIVAEKGRVEWQVILLEEKNTATVERAIRASYPDVQVEEHPLETYFRAAPTVYRYVCKYRQTASSYLAPIKHVADIKDSDPLASVVAAMGKLEAGERVSYTLFVFGQSQSVYTVGREQIYRKVYDSLLSLAFPQEVPVYDTPVQRVLETKLQTELYQCLLLIQIDTPVRERLLELIVVDSQLVLFDREQFNTLRRFDEKSVYLVEDDAFDFQTSTFGLYQQLLVGSPTHDIKEMRQAIGLVLEPREIAALWHLPHEGFHGSPVKWMKKQHPISEDIAQLHHGLGLGMGIYHHSPRPVYWEHDQRTTHMSIIGKTGYGKTNFLHVMIHQDIAAGRGVAVVDPHGNRPDSLIRRILQQSIPVGREQDVVVLDLANPKNPPPLNLLGMSRGDGTMKAANEVVMLLAQIYVDIQETQWHSTLQHMLYTLWHDPTATLLDINRLFADDAYRSELAQHIGVEGITTHSFWADFALKEKGIRQKMREPIEWRIQSLLSNPLLLPSLCHPDAISFSELMEANKIILISLGVDSDAVPDTEQNLLASLLISAIERASFRRHNTQLFSVTIDEAQRFVATSLPKAFAEVRKSGVAFTLAHQYLKQLPEKVKDAIFGNVGAIISFQISAEDAGYIAKYMRPAFDPDDLIQMDKFQAAAWIRQGNRTQPAFSLTMPPPIKLNNEQQALARERELRGCSIQQYTPMSRDAILAWIKDRYMPVQMPTSGNSAPNLNIPPDRGTYD